ncbi:MAG: hypothetical protein JW704_10555, partial [Anaerolineaceae bacterium]|nr:hypothetical protein [Anaerolineaceae bacterium]
RIFPIYMPSIRIMKLLGNASLLFLEWDKIKSMIQRALTITIKAPFGWNFPQDQSHAGLPDEGQAVPYL